MTDLVIKYNALNKSSQKQVNAFMDFLLSKQKKNKSKINYKSKILSVSKWTDSDLEAFKNNQSLFNHWQIEEW